jgi:hypothetical protein
MANILDKNPIYLTATAASTTGPLWIQKIVLVPAAAADVATFTYTMGGTIYSFASLKSQDTRAMNYELDFGPDGIYVPNLTLATLSNNAVLYIYLV